MSHRAPIATAGISAGGGLLCVLALSLVLPALGNTVALVTGSAAGVGLAFRGRLARQSTPFRLGLAGVLVGMAGLLWVNLQPAYIGI